MPSPDNATAQYKEMELEQWGTVHGDSAGPSERGGFYKYFVGIGPAGRLYGAFHPEHWPGRGFHAAFFVVLFAVAYVALLAFLFSSETQVDSLATLAFNSIGGILISVSVPAVFGPVVFNILRRSTVFDVLARVSRVSGGVRRLRTRSIIFTVAYVLSSLLMCAFFGLAIYTTYVLLPTVGDMRYFGPFTATYCALALCWSTYFWGVSLLSLVFLSVELWIEDFLRRIRLRRLSLADVLRETDELLVTLRTMSTQYRLPLLAAVFCGVGGGFICIFALILFPPSTAASPLANGAELAFIGLVILWVLVLLFAASRVSSALSELPAAVARWGCEDSAEESEVERINALVTYIATQPLAVTLVGFQISMAFVTGLLSTLISAIVLVIQRLL